MLDPAAGLCSVGTPTTLPDELSSTLEAVRAWTNPGVLALHGPDHRAAWLHGLQQLIDATEVAFTSVLAEFDANADGTTLSGSANTAGWLRHQLRLSGSEACARVAIARRQSVLDEPLVAAATGSLTFNHVRAINVALRSVEHDADATGRAVPLLHELAERTDPTAVRLAGRRLLEVVDPDGALTSRERCIGRRRLTLSPLLDGMTAIEGVLDAQAATTLSAALAPLMVPCGADDLRSSGQRRADALTELAELALRSEQLHTSAAALPPSTWSFRWPGCWVKASRDR